jgi:hypothetical protein
VVDVLDPRWVPVIVRQGGDVLSRRVVDVWNPRWDPVSVRHGGDVLGPWLDGGVRRLVDWVGSSRSIWLHHRGFDKRLIRVRRVVCTLLCRVVDGYIMRRVVDDLDGSYCGVACACVSGCFVLRGGDGMRLLRGMCVTQIGMVVCSVTDVSVICYLVHEYL